MMPENNQGFKKRKFEQISYLRGTPTTLYLEAQVGGRPLQSIIDTGATVSAVSSRHVRGDQLEREKSVAVKLGNGQVVFSKGQAELEVNLGRHHLLQKVLVLDTDAFDCLLGMDFLQRDPVQGILFRPARLVVQGDEYPLKEESGTVLNRLFRVFQTEAYQLLPVHRNSAIAKLGLDREQIQVDLFASQKNKQEALFCSRRNSAWRYDWSLLASGGSVLWANPPFSKIEQVLTKVVLEKVRMVITTPEWGASGSSARWRSLLDRMTVARVALPAGEPTYMTERGKVIPAPKWLTTVSLLDGSLLQEGDLTPSVVRHVRKMCKCLGLRELKKILGK